MRLPYQNSGCKSITNQIKIRFQSYSKPVYASIIKAFLNQLSTPGSLSARSFLQRSDVGRLGVHGLRVVGWRCDAAAEDSAGGATLYPAGGALGGAEL